MHQGAPFSWQAPRRHAAHRRLAVWAGAGALALAVAGCTSHAGRPGLDASGRSAEPTSFTTPFFDYEPGFAPQIRNGGTTANGSHTIYRLEAASEGYNNQPGNRIGASYYRSGAPGAKRLVVVLPIWGASAYPPRALVNGLLKRKNAARTNILWLDGEKKMLDLDTLRSLQSQEELDWEVERTVTAIRNTVADVRRFLDWGLAEDDVDPASVGIVGFSISAMIGAMVMAVDERIASGVFAMGGAHFHEILAHCPRGTGEARANVLAQLGWTAEEYERYLEGPLEAINPVSYVGAIPPRPALLLDAARDDCIPETARHDFWQAMGRPERLSIHCKHRMAFLSFSPLGFRHAVRRIARFFDETLPAS